MRTFHCDLHVAGSRRLEAVQKVPTKSLLEKCLARVTNYLMCINVVVSP